VRILQTAAGSRAESLATWEYGRRPSDVHLRLVDHSASPSDYPEAVGALRPLMPRENTGGALVTGSPCCASDALKAVGEERCLVIVGRTGPLWRIAR